MARTKTAAKKTVAKEAAPAPSSTDEILTTTELVSLAKKRMSPGAWDLVVGGAESETTSMRNRYALDSIAFRPRVLRNVENASPATSFLGMTHRMPVLLAPVASLSDVHPEGALPVARAAKAFGCLMLVSSVTKPGFEDVARAAGEQFAMQLYTDGEDKWCVDFAKRAEQAGAKALCITVDVPTFGRRERHIHRRAAMTGRPFGALRVGEMHRSRAEWKLIEKLKRAVKIPVMVKGIQTAEDAELAIKQGVDIVYVSNHGGRQLDHCRGAIDLLPEIISVARGKAQFVLDGGFMRGTDVLKAVGRGAAMVGMGKLQALALGADGERGVMRMLEILETELTVSMKLLGARTIDEIDGTFLQPATPMSAPGVLSALPLL